MQLTLADFEDLGNKQFRLVINTEEYRDYTVTETTKDIDGNSVTVSYKVTQDETESEGTGDSAAFAIEQGKTTKVDFEDDYEKIGTLELTKTIKGEVTEDEYNGALTFEITTTEGEGEGQKTLYLNKAGELGETPVQLTLADFEDLGNKQFRLVINTEEYRDYTVTETTKDIDGNSVTVSYKVTQDETESEGTGDSAAFSIEQGKTTKVDFEDDYEKVGTLELTKTIKGEVTEDEYNGALTFEITTTEGEGETQKTLWL